MRPLIHNRPGWSETTDRDELGYGTVYLFPGELSYWNGLKRRFRKPGPTTMHVGWEDAAGEFHEEDKWIVKYAEPIPGFVSRALRKAGIVKTKGRFSIDIDTDPPTINEDP